MSGESGFSADTPAGFGLFGVLYKAFDTQQGSGTKVGVSRGGLRYVPNITMSNVQYDGKMVARVGLDRITGRNPQITGTLLQLTNENLMMLEPGGATPDDLIPQGQFLVVGDYLVNVAVVFKRPNGNLFGYRFPYAIVETYEITGQGADGEVEATFTVAARLRGQGATPDESEVPVEYFEYEATP